MADKQVQISALVLDEIAFCLDNLMQVNGGATPEAKALNARAGKSLAAVVQILRGTQGPGSFSGGETGQYKLDPTQSQFL